MVSFTWLQFAVGQTQQDFVAYIARYKNVALEEMVRCGIPASITLAQGMHESSCGRSPLSREANNHFGIKCKAEWDGKKYYMNDDQPNECFRVYEHAEDSYADHSDFLVTRPRYADLFNLPKTDYKAWARGLKEAGYATNPKYAQILISKIEEYHLDEYDRIGLAMIEEKAKLFAFNAVPGKEAPQAVAINSKTKTSAPINENKPAKATPLTSVSTSVATTTASVKPVKESSSQNAYTAYYSVTKTKPVKEVAAKETEQKHNLFESPSREPERKVFTVNGSMVLLAHADEDPLKIAYDYNVDYTHLMEFNDLGTGEHFKEGEYIYLQAKKNSGQQETYTVSAGESMRDVSQKTGIKLRLLYQKNQMNMTTNEQAYTGESLNLQEKRATAPRTMSYSEFLKATDSDKDKNNTATASVDNESYNTNEYQVQPSDTLYSIARKFNMSVAELKSLNNLQDANLQAGQKLVVSK